MSKIRCTHPTPLLLPQEDLGSAQSFQLLRDNPSKETFSISVEVDIYIQPHAWSKEFLPHAAFHRTLQFHAFLCLLTTIQVREQIDF